MKFWRDRTPPPPADPPDLYEVRVELDDLDYLVMISTEVRAAGVLPAVCLGVGRIAAYIRPGTSTPARVYAGPPGGPYEDIPARWFTCPRCQHIVTNDEDHKGWCHTCGDWTDPMSDHIAEVTAGIPAPGEPQE